MRCVDRFLGCLNQLSQVVVTIALGKSLFQTHWEFLLATDIYSTLSSTTGHFPNVSSIPILDIIFLDQYS